MVMRPKPTGSATQKKKIQEMLKKKKKDALKNKVKEKLKNKKKTKSTKTGLLSKAGLMPVSTPGGIPKVMSQKTAQKDLKPKRRPTPGKEIDRMPRPPKGFPDNPSILRPKNPPRKFTPMGGPAMTREMKRKLKENGAMAFAPGGDVTPSQKAITDLAKKIKSSGRLSTTDLKRAKALLTGPQNRLKLLRKGLKPVLDSKGNPVKNLTQKAGSGKAMTPEARKQLRRLLDNVNMRTPKIKMPKRKKQGPKGMIPLMGTAGKGMRKGFGNKNLKSAAKKLKRIM